MRLEPATAGLNRDSAPSVRVLWAGVLILVLWTLWQCVAIEAMRLPWEDEILYMLPSVNWATGGPFALPQLGHFMDADTGWRWHLPLFPVLAAVWVKAFGYQLPVLRLFSLLPATFMAFLLARCCVRLAGQRDWPWFLFWLGIILGDKSIVMNSLSGRMEFWCLLAVIGSVALVLNSGGSPGSILAGILLGLAVGFHPLALYFLPGLLWISATGGLGGSEGLRWKHAVLFAMGFGLVILGIVLWFVADWPLTQAQFLAQVHGTVSSSLAHNAGELLAGLKYNFRFQPFFLFMALAAVVVHLWHILGPGRSRKAVSAGLLLLAAGLMAFLLQEPTIHLNYYPALVLVALLLLAGSLPVLRQVSPRAQTFAVAMLFLLLANNLLFIGAKTRTAWLNRDLLDPAPMNAFLDAELKGTNRSVLPPNLWPYAMHHHLNFRVNFLPVLGQPEQKYQDYLQTLLDWRPETIVLDRGDARLRPDRYFTPEQMAAAGYVEQAHFDRVFRDRYLYDGYRLVVYQRRGAS